MHVVLVEPDDAELLYPFSLTHGAWELRSGYYTIMQRCQAALPDCRVLVHTQRDLILESFVSRSEGYSAAYEGGPTLLILANILLAPSTLRSMVDLCRSVQRPVHFLLNGNTAGVFLSEHHGNLDEIPSALDAVQADALDAVHIEGHAVTRLWHALDHIADAISWDAEILAQNLRSNSSEVHHTVVIDESAGPVILGDNVVVGPFCVLQGPIALGDDSIVKPHSHLRETVTGPSCRISGEISASVFHSYSNKQHAGFVGNSYIGSWVNLGAETTTSNLKNTYSHVRPQLPWAREDSQRMFLGSLVGDHTRTAIGTLLPTGAVLGVSVCVLTTSPAPSSQRSFMWGDTRYQLPNALATIKTVMSRRGMDVTEAELALLEQIHNDDAAE